MPVGLLATPDGWPRVHPSAPETDNFSPVAGRDYPAGGAMERVEATTVQLGKPRELRSFGWDNEYGQCERAVSACDVATAMVSNGEFLEFVKVRVT